MILALAIWIAFNVVVLALRLWSGRCVELEFDDVRSEVVGQLRRETRP